MGSERLPHRHRWKGGREGQHSPERRRGNGTATSNALPCLALAEERAPEHAQHFRPTTTPPLLPLNTHNPPSSPAIYRVTYHLPRSPTALPAVHHLPKSCLPAPNTKPNNQNANSPAPPTPPDNRRSNHSPYTSLTISLPRDSHTPPPRENKGLINYT